MIPDDVVNYSLSQLDSDRVMVIPGWRCRLLGFVMRMPLLKPLVRSVMRSRNELSTCVDTDGTTHPSFTEQSRARLQRRTSNHESLVNGSRQVGTKPT